MESIIDTYVSIDLETTGLHPKQDKIIEIGAVKVEKGVITQRFSSLVNPGRKLEGRIAELTGIGDEQLQDAPELDEIFPGLLDFLGQLPLLGHRVLFDYSFLKKAAVDRRLVFEKQAVDTLKIARKYLPHLERRNLDYLCEYYQIPHHAHRAMEDAQAASRLYERMVREFYQPEDAVFKLHPLHFQVKRDTPATRPQKERLYHLLEQHKIIPEADVEKLTRSEASRLTDKILAAYGRL